MINFPQDIHAFVTDLPKQLAAIDIILVRRTGVDTSNFKEFHVRRSKIEAALIWLKENNEFYKDITINRQNLEALPENGFVDDQLRGILDERHPHELEGKGAVGPLDAGEDVNGDREPLETFALPATRQIADTAAIQNAVADM